MMYRYIKAFCEMLNDDANLQLKLDKVVYLQDVEHALDIWSLHEQEIGLDKVKQNNDMDIKKAQILTEDIYTRKL